VIKRSFDNEQLLHDSVGKTISLIDKGDALSQISYSQSVVFENDKLQSIDDISHSILGCRVFKHNKVGNSFVNNPTLYKQMVENSINSAKFGKEINIKLPKNQEYKLLEWTYNKNHLEYSKHDLKDIAEELLVKIKKFAPEAKISTNIHMGYSQFTLQNTNGFNGFYEESNLSLCGGLFELAEDGTFLEMYESYSYYDEDVNFDNILQPLQERIERSRKSSKFEKTGKFPVIFAPSVVDLLLEPIEIAVNGKTLSKGLSLFENKLHDKLFDEKLTIIDDPFYYHGNASMPFDDEGVVGEKIKLIEKGYFKNFIFDCTIAAKMNTNSTGHATRSVSGLPYPSLTNRIIQIGENSLNEMIQGIDYGLLLVSSLGEGQSNVIAGDFSVLAESAFLIENGILKGRVKDIMISGNIFDLLKDIPMIENRLYQESSLFTPHIMINNVQISTK